VSLCDPEKKGRLQADKPNYNISPDLNSCPQQWKKVEHQKSWSVANPFVQSTTRNVNSKGINKSPTATTAIRILTADVYLAEDRIALRART